MYNDGKMLACASNNLTQSAETLVFCDLDVAYSISQHNPKLTYTHILILTHPREVSFL